MSLNGFEKRLKAVCTNRGFIQQKFATVLGVIEQTVSKWECCLSYPDITMLDSIAESLGCSLDFLFHRENGTTNLLSQESLERREEIKDALLPDIFSLEFGTGLVTIFQKEMKNGFPLHSTA